jgi:hypothetical protein
VAYAGWGGRRLWPYPPPWVRTPFFYFVCAALTHDARANELKWLHGPFREERPSLTARGKILVSCPPGGASHDLLPERE